MRGGDTGSGAAAGRGGGRGMGGERRIVYLIVIYIVNTISTGIYIFTYIIVARRVYYNVQCMYTAFTARGAGF